MPCNYHSRTNFIEQVKIRIFIKSIDNMAEIHLVLVLLLDNR